MLTDRRVEKAMSAVQDRLDSIAVALDDVKPSALGTFTRGQFQSDKATSDRYSGRTYNLFVLVAHLRDDAKRLATRLGKSGKVVDQFIKNTLSIQLSIRVADSKKHGLGGRSKNATILNGILTAVKIPAGKAASPQDLEIPIGMIIVDGAAGTFHSNVVLAASLRAWIDFFRDELDLDLSDWEAANLISREKPSIYLPDGHGSVPLGVVATFDIPEEVDGPLIDDVRRRATDI